MHKQEASELFLVLGNQDRVKIMKFLYNNDIIYTMRVGHYEKFDRMFPIFINMSSEVYAKLLTKEYTIDRQLTIHDSEDNVVPIVKPTLEVKNHKTKTKQKKY